LRPFHGLNLVWVIILDHITNEIGSNYIGLIILFYFLFCRFCFNSSFWAGINFEVENCELLCYKEALAWYVPFPPCCNGYLLLYFWFSLWCLVKFKFTCYYVCMCFVLKIFMELMWGLLRRLEVQVESLMWILLFYIAAYRMNFCLRYCISYDLATLFGFDELLILCWISCTVQASLLCLCCMLLLQSTQMRYLMWVCLVIFMK
jgi:hypothetical protein